MGDKRFVADLKFLVGFFILLNLLTWSSGLEFKTIDRTSSSSSTRNMKLQLRKKTLATSALTPHGLIIDRPKIQVISYRVKSTDPWVIQDDLNCVDGYCDELVESSGKRGHEKDHLKLGQGDGELSEWSVPPNVTQILLECQSKSGPVEWDYEGRGSIPNIEIENTRLTGDFWTLTSYTHVSQLVVRKISDQLTGVYSCRNVDKPMVTNSFNMFVPQESLEILEDGRLIKIMPPSHSAEVIIPCRQSDRDTSIYLFKKLKDGSLRKVNMNNGVRFDPYVGFYLRISRETFGRYICKIGKSDKSSRKRREAFQSDVVQTSTSPGILAFPTSEELLLDQLMVEDSTADRSRYSVVSLPPFPISDSIVGQSPLARQEFLPQPNFETPSSPALSFGPLGQPKKVKRRRKNPLMRRHGTPAHNGLLRRRGGPPPAYHGQRHPGPPFRPRRPGPGLFMNFRRHPSTNHPHYNHPHPISQASPYSSHDPGHFIPEGGEAPGYFGPSPMPYPPPVVSPAKVLPTFLNKGGNRIKPFASSEEHSSETKPSQLDDEMTMIDLSSRVDSKSNSSKRYKPPKRGAAVLLSPSLPSQTMKIMSSMHCVLKKVMLGPNATCNGTFFDTSLISQKPVGSGGIVGSSAEQKTILEVDVVPAPENKFFPNATVLYTTVPFFVKWQTRFTDYADWADVNHTLKDGTFKRHKSGGFENGVNTFEIYNLQEGESGKITEEYMGRNKEIHHHTWKFFVINSTVNEAKGLKHEEIGRMQTFTCRSSSSNKPYIRLTYLSEEGCPIKDLSDGNDDSKRSMKNLRKEVVEDCGPGCSLIKSDLEFGLVHCVGDGVDEKIRFPQDLHCTGRPYFVQRGTSKNMTFEADQKLMVFPCLINNPTADVFLFHQDLNGSVVDVTDFATYELKQGFSLDVTKVKDPKGTYICTSTTDLVDETDIVTYNVVAASDFKFVPEQEEVFGAPPFKFMWEAREELELENKSAGSFYSGIFANPEGSRPNVGTFEISSLPEGKSGELRVLKSSDKTVMHVWSYKHTVKPRLWLDKKRNVFRCQATSENVPTLIAVECSSSNVCNLKSRFLEGEKSGRDNSECGRGCAQLKVWGNKPTGFVKCEGDGIDEKLHYFLSNNSTLVTERDDLEPLRTPEITNAVKQLRIGESTNFKCSASKYFYSKGFQWAIETRSGSKRFVDFKIKDDDYFLNEVRSEIRLKVMDQDWKAVWCFAPVIDSNLWRNASQPIYIKL